MFTFNHYNYNVLDLEKSMAFYAAALGLKEVRRKEAPDGSWKLVYLGDGKSDFTLRADLAARPQGALQPWQKMNSILLFRQRFRCGTCKAQGKGCICFAKSRNGI